MADAPEMKPPVNTKVKLGNIEVELKDMPTETGLKLYAALPADYQKQADQIAEVVTVFGSVAQVAQKHNIDPTELAQSWLRTAANTDVAKAARTSLSDVQRTAIDELKAMNISVDSVARMIPGGQALLGTAQVASGAAAVIGTAASAAGAAMDGAWNGGPRVWHLLSTMAKEGKGLIIGYGSGAPKDEARAFGAATMAIRYQSVQDRHSLPMVDLPFNGKESQLETNPGAVALSGWDAVVQWIKINMPTVMAAISWLTDWSDKKPSWEQLKADANAESVALKNGKAKSFQEQVDIRAIPADNEHAQSVLEAAEKVAGLNAKALAKVATASVDDKAFTFQNTSGVDVTLEKGKVVAQVTPLDRVVNAAKVVKGDGDILGMGGVRLGATAAGIATVANNGAKGIVRGLTANVVNPSAATEAVMDWAHKPAQVGIGPNAWSTGAKSWINFPGKIAVGVGDVTGRATRWMGNVVAGTASAAKNFVVGGVEGVHAAANGANVAATASKVEAASKFLSGNYTKYLPWAAPVASGSNMLAEISKGETSSAVIHGVETVGLGAAIKTVGIAGAARLSPYIAPVMSVTEGVIAAKDGNMIGVKKAGVELGTMASFTAAGAGVGAFFGGVGAVPGALVGATIGGIASLFSGKMYENGANNRVLIAQNAPASPPTGASTETAALAANQVSALTPSTGALPANPALAAAAVEQEARTAAAQAKLQANAQALNVAKAGDKKLAFANVKSVDGRLPGATPGASRMVANAAQPMPVG